MKTCPSCERPTDTAAPLCADCWPAYPAVTRCSRHDRPTAISYGLTCRSCELEARILQEWHARDWYGPPTQDHAAYIAKMESGPAPTLTHYPEPTFEDWKASAYYTDQRSRPIAQHLVDAYRLEHLDATDTSRRYPICCTLQYCGKMKGDRPRLDCNETCPDYPTNRRFETWRETRQAVQLDPIWGPNYHTATR